jgi:hypothetical protein
MSNDTDNNDDRLDSTDTIKKRVTITIEDCTLPLAEDDREEALEDLEDAIGDLLHGYMEPGSITTATSYRYAAIEDNCPLCSLDLELRDYTYTHNGASAEANCPDPDCGWRGTAIYRLTDLEGGRGSTFESAVLTGDATPSYHPY